MTSTITAVLTILLVPSILVLGIGLAIVVACAFMCLAEWVDKKIKERK
jgi:hypothetical protein